VAHALQLPLLGVLGPIYSPSRARLNNIRRYALAPAVTSLILAATFLAAAGVVLATKYPGRYAQMIEQMGPTAKAVRAGMQSLLGAL
jgi:hypothetical protein